MRPRRDCNPDSESAFKALEAPWGLIEHMARADSANRRQWWKQVGMLASTLTKTVPGLLMKAGPLASGSTTSTRPPRRAIPGGRNECLVRTRRRELLTCSRH
jgi:hypothetical protein